MRLKALLLATIAALVAVAMITVSFIPAGAHPGNGSGHEIALADGGRRIIGSDHTGDGDFSLTCAFDDRQPDPILGPLGVPPTGQTVGNCDNDIPQMDMTSWEFAYLPPSHPNALTSATVLGNVKVGTLEAKWTFAGAWPAANAGPLVAGDQSPEPITTLDARMQFRNPFLEINDIVPSCQQTDGPIRRTEHGDDHWLDQHFLFIWYTYASEATGWDGNISFGYYQAYADDEIHSSIGDFETNNWYCGAANCSTAGKDPGNGGRYFHSVSGNTVTVRIPTIYVDQNTFCNNDVEYFPFALTAADRASQPTRTDGSPLGWPAGGSGNNDQITDVRASAGIGTLVGTPVPIPVGDITGNTICPVLDAGADLRAQLRQQVEQTTGPLPAFYPWVTCGPALRPGNSIQWLLGLAFFAEASSLTNGFNSSHGGLLGLGLPELLSTTVMPGLGCMEGELGDPDINPFITPGQPCSIANPVGARPNLRNTAATITVAN